MMVEDHHTLWPTDNQMIEGRKFEALFPGGQTDLLRHYSVGSCGEGQIDKLKSGAGSSTDKTGVV